MKDTELKRQRDRDIYDMYKLAISQHTFHLQRDAVRWVLRQPAPRFYISSKAASNLVYAMENGHPLLNIHGSSRRRLNEIYSRYRYMVRSGEAEGLSKGEIFERIVESQAPSWYVGDSMAELIIRKERARAQEELKKRFRR